MATIISQDKLKEIVDYDQYTGIFYRKTRGGSLKPGDIAGTPSEGYIKIMVDRKRYFVHRLVWLYVYGYFPELEIDHINGIKDDNRLPNLRLATHAQNMSNMKLKSNNTSGYKGVCWHKSNMKWFAQIRVDKKFIFLGYFDTPEKAYSVYQIASIKYHKEFSNN